MTGKKRKSRKSRFRRSARRWWKTMTTGKKFTCYLMILLTAVVIFSMVMMWRLNDISMLDSLTAPIIGAVVGFAVYMAKSAVDHKNGVFDGSHTDDPSADSSLLFPSDNEEDKQ